ncbi:DUF1499 domain-containing protein [Nereida sp. MMG025]|uniref:DUF1499 domain-containing protein n=1 Tax=Nereida sp. MMG025 TaxID=2909981 RepID=UPI001F463D23|nr:DUF1499 domain-containing protein [Nereida sp. MMG025]MCF6443453.1 DUF1499 domain-containing protein [Nereida sp. MMG025]
MIGWILTGLAVAVVATMIYVRVTPVNTDRAPKPQNMAAGDYPVAGGFYAVRDKAADKRDALIDVIENTPRTRKLSDGIYVTRSALWGFPDVTRVWTHDDTLHVSGHLVYGRSDLGVNRKRIEDWLQQAGV